MSTLWDACRDRYDEQGLLELTNVRDPEAREINDAQGERAVTAITALFPVYVQDTFDSTEQGHIEVGCEGVIALLFRWGGSTHRIAATHWDEWIAFARDWRNTHARARIEPTSSVPANKQPSAGPQTPTTPWSDDRRFDGLSPRDGSESTFAPDV